MADMPAPILTEDLAPINRIRVETALSRFPIHRLSKTGVVSIDLRGLMDGEQTDFQWKVSYTTEYGQPGPLAYKIDTLIVNRRLDAAPRPLPELLKLGSLREICRELGVSDHDTEPVKNALHQNASAYITAKIRCPKKGRKPWTEIGYNRYSMVFTGETLPDGTQADAVYLILNPQYRKLLNEVEVRPLDYNYLFDLNPAPQRLYELLSFPMYGALSHDRPRARLRYSDFCLFAPVTRYYDYDPVKKQMSKIHKPHRESGYIAKAQFEETVDAQGKRDWEMLYTPGPKAIAEFQAFARKSIAPPPAPSLPALPKLQLTNGDQPVQATLDLTAVDATLLEEITRRGIAEKKACSLLANIKPGQQVMDQLEYTDFMIAQAPRGKFHNPPGLYIRNIEQNITLPANFATSRQRKLRETAQQAKDAKYTRELQLKNAYEEYCSQAVDRFIREQLPQQEYKQLHEQKTRVCRGLFKQMTKAQLDEIVHRYIAADLKENGSVGLPSFEEFCRLQATLRKQPELQA